jgi:hypothetical protein
LGRPARSDHGGGDRRGLIEEAGYEQQAKSYALMAQASRMSADAEDKAAQGSTITSIVKGAAGVASLFQKVSLV